MEHELQRLLLTRNGQFSLESQNVQAIRNDQCRVRLRFAGVCSSDIYRAFEGWAYHYPLVMGHELSGVIEEVGSEVDNFEVGDRVAVFPLLPCFDCDQCHTGNFVRCKDYSYYGSRQDGGFASELAINKWNLLKVPDGVSLNDASLVEPCSVVLHALDKFKLPKESSRTMLVLGTGFLGLLAIELATKSSFGIKLHACDRNRQKIRRAENLFAIGHMLDNEQSWEQFLDEHTSHFDYIFETTGNPENFTKSINLTKPGGKIVWMGNPTGTAEFQKNDLSAVLRKELTIQGTWNSTYDPFLESDWSKVLTLMSNGFSPSKLVSHEIGLHEVPDYLQRMHQHKIRAKEFTHVKVQVKHV